MIEQQLSRESESNMLDYKEERRDAHPKINLQEGLKKLSRYGGMKFLKTLLKDIDHLDPQRRAARSIFLADPVYRDARKKLAKELKIWIDILRREDSDIAELQDYCTRNIDAKREVLQSNLLKIRGEIAELERSYRTLDSFFQNTAHPDKPVHCLNLINVSRQRIADVDSEDGKTVRREILVRYDNLDLRSSYSLLVIPDFFRQPSGAQTSATAVELRRWAKVADANKLILLTDFEDSFSYEDLCTRLNAMDLQDNDRSAASVVLTCNHILARRRSELADEEEDFFIPASASLAGRMSDTGNIIISQGVAGQRFGAIDRALGVRFPLLKSEISALIDKGVVPMIELDGRVMAFSNNTLYDGQNKWLKEYPIVRIFNWVNKVIQHFCNTEALIVWNSEVRKDMETVLMNFLEQYKEGKLYEDYLLKNIVQDKDTRDIHVQVEIKPFYAARNFLIELTGKNHDTSVEWEQNVVYLDK